MARRRNSRAFFAVIGLCACGRGDTKAVTAEDLAIQFRRAHERRDVPALLALVRSDCATKEMLALTESTLRSHLADTIRSVRIDPPLVSRVPSFVRDGRRFELSVPLQGELVVVYDTVAGRMTSHPIGPTPDGVRIGIMCEK